MTQVHILLATHNGAAFLQEQLQSYLDQSHQDWSLWVSDDASSDNTREIVKAFQRAHPDRQVRLLLGPNQGLFANFMHLLRHPDVPLGFVALSDQDDVWLPHHLSHALAALETRDSCAFYCSTQVLTDARLKPLRERPPRPLPRPSFQNALVQNLASGNTIMLNPQAFELLRNDPSPPSTLPYHDWWIYLRLLAADAALICDPRPGLLYRQHSNNVLGDRGSRRLYRLRALLDGTYGTWVQNYTKALLMLPPDTVSPCHRTAAKVLHERKSRLQALQVSGAFRHDRIGRLALPALAFLHRF